jgi:hypothetical protein
MVDDVLGEYDGADMHRDDPTDLDSRRSSANLSNKSRSDKSQRRALPHHSPQQGFSEFTRPKQFPADPQELLLQTSPLPWSSDKKSGGKSKSWALSADERQSFLSSLMNVSMGNSQSGAPSQSKEKADFYMTNPLPLSPLHSEALTVEERRVPRQPVDHFLSPLWEVARERGPNPERPVQTPPSREEAAAERLCFSHFDHSKSNEFNNRVALLRYEGVVSSVQFLPAFVISSLIDPL